MVWLAEDDNNAVGRKQERGRDDGIYTHSFISNNATMSFILLLPVRLGWLGSAPVESLGCGQRQEQEQKLAPG